MAQAPGTVDPWAWVPPDWTGAPGAGPAFPPPEWGAPILPPPTGELPPTVEPGDPTIGSSPEDVAKARAFAEGAADALFTDDVTTQDGEEDVGVKLGFPTNPDENPLTPEEEALIGPGLEDEPGDVVVPTDGQAYKVGGPIDPYAAEPIDPYAPDLDFATDDEAKAAEHEAKIAELADLDPEAFAKIQTERLIKTEHERATREIEIAQRQREQIEANEARRVAARQAAGLELEKIKGEATALADGTPFSQWWSTRSTGQKFAGYIAAMLGGFLQSQTGGRNSAIDFMMKLADDEANAKWGALRERKGLATDSMAQADADFSGREAVRLATYEQVARGLEAELASLDPQGTAAIKVAQAVREVRARQAAAGADTEEALFQRADKMIQRDQDQQRIAIDAAKAQSEIDKRQAEIAKLNRAGVGGGTSASKQKHDPAVLAARHGVDPKLVEGLPPMTEAEFGKVLEVAGKAKALKAPTEEEKRAHTLRITGPSGILSNPKDAKVPGDQWVLGDPEVTRVKMDTAQGIVALLDEADAIRSRVGGESEWGNSVDFQRLDTIAAELPILAKSGTEGMSSDADVARIVASIGAKDLTSYRSQDARIKQARAMTTAKINRWLTSHGYEGEPIAYPKRKAPAKTPDQREAGKLIESTTGEKGQAIPSLVAAVSPAGLLARATESLVRSESTTLGDGDEKAQLDQWIDEADDPDPKLARKARSLLRQMDKSKSPAIRKYAKSALDAIGVSDVTKKIGKKPGEKGFVGALINEIYTSVPDEDPETEEEE